MSENQKGFRLISIEILGRAAIYWSFMLNCSRPAGSGKTGNCSSRQKRVIEEAATWSLVARLSLIKKKKKKARRSSGIVFIMIGAWSIIFGEILSANVEIEVGTSRARYESLLIITCYSNYLLSLFSDGIKFNINELYY